MLEEINQNDLPILMLFTWDESKGPQLLNCYPAINHELSNKLGLQIFLITSSIFGTGDYEQEMVDVPITNFGIRVRVFFNYELSNMVRGGRQPYILLIAYTNPLLSTVLTILQEKIVVLLSKYLKDKSFDLLSLYEDLYEYEILYFTTLDEFLEIILIYSNSVCFGLVTGITIRQSLLPNVDPRPYLSDLTNKSSMKKLSMIFIRELGEYWYTFWIGPFSFLFQQPLSNLKQFQVFLDKLPKVLDKLWSLAINDSTCDTQHFFGKINFTPDQLLIIHHLIFTDAELKTSGRNSQLLEPALTRSVAIFFYVHNLALDMLQYDKKLYSSKLEDYQHQIDPLYWEGFQLTLGFYIGRKISKDLKNFDNFTDNKKILALAKFFYNKIAKVRVISIRPLEIHIYNCPYCNFSIQCNFSTGFFLGFLNKNIIKINKISPFEKLLLLPS